MTRRKFWRRNWFGPLAAALLSLIVFLPGLGWGLPWRGDDRFLFGDRDPWTGREVIALAGGFDAQADAAAGADVDQNPLEPAAGATTLNATDADRAEIVRRFRIFTHQPDEWNTLRSLAGMDPRRFDFDPKLYQYGGLWVYPIGALLKLATYPGYVELTGDLSHYLEQPKEIGRLYLVARLYVALWAAAGVGVAYVLARRLGGSGPVAAAAVALLPVIVHTSHEAKPHLPAAILSAATVILSAAYVEVPKISRAAASGAMAGAAAGMTLVGGPALLAALAGPLLLQWNHALAGRPRTLERIKHSVLILFAAAAVYTTTNPYVLINFFRGDAGMSGNLGTTAGMYSDNFALAGWVNGAFLLLHGATLPIAALAAAGAAVLLLSRPPKSTFSGATASPEGQAVSGGGMPCPPGQAVASGAVPPPGVQQAANPRVIALLLLIVSFATFVPYAAVAAGKPAEHGRFAVFCGIAMVLLAVGGLGQVRRAWVRRVGYAAVVASAAAGGLPYLVNYVADTGRSTRDDAARFLATLPPGDLGMPMEPAPYRTPPADLWRWRWQLLGPDAAPATWPDTVVTVEDWPGQTPTPPGFARHEFAGPAVSPMSWAAKPVVVFVRDPAPAAVAVRRRVPRLERPHSAGLARGKKSATLAEKLGRTGSAVIVSGAR